MIGCVSPPNSHVDFNAPNLEDEEMGSLGGGWVLRVQGEEVQPSHDAPTLGWKAGACGRGRGLSRPLRPPGPRLQNRDREACVSVPALWCLAQQPELPGTRGRRNCGVSHATRSGHVFEHRLQSCVASGRP